MIENQCWAYSKERQRCQGQAGHEGEHGIVFNWTDDDCFDPETDSTTVWRERPAGGSTFIGLTNTDTPLPIYAVPIPHDDDGGTPGRCFTCNCSAAAHEPDGCLAHSCKTYLA